MSTFTSTLPQTVDIIAAGIKATLGSAIQAEVQKYRDDLVKQIDEHLAQACLHAAENVTAKIAHFDNRIEDKIELHVLFNEKPVARTGELRFVPVEPKWAKPK